MSESHEYLIKNSWVSKVNADVRSCIQLDIWLNGPLLSFGELIELAAPTVKEPADELEAICNAEVHEGHKRLNNHGSFNLFANHHVPVRAEVWELILNWKETKLWILQVGVLQDQQDTSVDVLADEDESHDWWNFFVDIVQTNSWDQNGANCSQNDVDDYNGNRY